MGLKSGLHASNRKGSWISRKMKSKQRDKKKSQLPELLPLDEGELLHIVVFLFLNYHWMHQEFDFQHQSLDHSSVDTLKPEVRIGEQVAGIIKGHHQKNDPWKMIL